MNRKVMIEKSRFLLIFFFKFYRQQWDDREKYFASVKRESCVTQLVLLMSCDYTISVINFQRKFYLLSIILFYCGPYGPSGLQNKQ